MRPYLLVAMLAAVPLLAGCLSSGNDRVLPDLAVDADVAPSLAYLPADPDLSLVLEELELFVDGAAGVVLHARVLKPEGTGPFPVVVEFTPYTAPGENFHANNLVHAEPSVCETAPARPAQCGFGGFALQFVRRGYAFAYADVRGTGDSSGCLALRGEADIDDSAKLIEALGTAPWSSGAVGYIGASYPGSEAHMAGLAAAKHAVPYLKAVVPVAASTSFYHYHHNDGVPYAGNHALGGTNAGYTQNAVSPTVNPQSPNYASRYAEEAACPTKENVADHGGLDQTGAYYEWWRERNLRARAPEVHVPVLMAQGLADWNVKPDHIATWFNDLEAPKTLIAGQWGHAYPRSRSDDCEVFTTPPTPPLTDATAPPRPVCDPAVPYGDWWQYVNAFFDTHLKGVDTGMFGTDVAWVQDDLGTWHRSANWPLLAEERSEITFEVSPGGALATTPPTAAAEEPWKACGRDQTNMGVAPLATVEGQTNPCYADGANTELVFVTAPFTNVTLLSGVPTLDLVLRSSAPSTHLVAVLDVVDGGRADAKPVDSDVNYADGARQNYGYLNPLYRNGLDAPEPLPDGQYTVRIDFYPQEDVVLPGQALRLTVRSHDDGRSIEFFGQGENTVLFGPELVNRLTLPVRPAALQGVRLPAANATADV